MNLLEEVFKLRLIETKSKKMKAAIRKQYGPPSDIEIVDLPNPDVKDREILVKVRATTVNRTDCAILTGKPFIMRFFLGLFKPRRATLGTDFSGEVVQVGKSANRFQVGDRVFGFNDEGLGSQAGYLTIDEQAAVEKMPREADFAQAAASIEGAHYAYNFLNKVDIQAGQKILVNGATGAIGSATVQILKYFGAEVVAVCDTESMGLVKSLGADEVIDYMNEDFTKMDHQFDFVFDAVGKSSFGKCKAILKENGVYISSELGWMAQNVFFALFSPILGKKKVKFPLPSNISASLIFIKERIEEGSFSGVIDRSYQIEQAADAYTYVQKGYKIGNVILVIP